MIKLTFCLTRLPHLTLDQFQDYWFNHHGPLVRTVMDELRIKRYVQLHSAPWERSKPITASRGGPEQYDGVAQLWWESWEDMARIGENPKAGAAGAMLLEDEKKFIDLPKSPLWYGEEKVIIAHGGEPTAPGLQPKPKDVPLPRA